jgi:hydroxybutyrate-dimer hydrolase
MDHTLVHFEIPADDPERAAQEVGGRTRSPVERRGISERRIFANSRRRRAFMSTKRVRAVAAVALCLGGIAGSTGSSAADSAPPFVVPRSLQVTSYDGVSDDLLSGGLNLAGLVNPVPPGFVDPLNPTPAELRRRGIHGNFRGIVDPVLAGGMGLLWGPQSPGTPSFPGVPFGLIPGVEYKAYLRVHDIFGNTNNVLAVVQIPRHFDQARPCIVAIPPSGSRGAYGGIAIGEWGLFRGCAVALPGKGTGTGFHLLGGDTAAYAVDDIDGVFGPVDQIGANAQFAVRDSRRLDSFIAEHPHRIATKHAHSQINPERLWGQFALKGIEFALWALNDHFQTPGLRDFTSRNTIVIAAAASNGAGAALRALEDDDQHLIHGLVVTEPNIGPRSGPFAIRFGDDPLFYPAGRSIYDSITLMGTYAPCAALAPTLAGTPFFGLPPLGAPPDALRNRCTSLKEKGLISGGTVAEQSASALAVLRANGYAVAQDWGIASHEVLNLWRSLHPTYAAAYGRFAVWENVCDVSFAATDAAGRPAPLPEEVAKRLFADSSGIPATGGINLIADNAQNGPILENLAVSLSTDRADLNLDGALCFRYLATGDPSLLLGLDLRARLQAILNLARVRFGVREIQTTGRLHGRPALIFHGRQDALVFPNTQSRAYYALNQVAEGERSRLSYIEVTPAQHFDAFISSLFLNPATGGAQFAPLHFYLLWGLDRMMEHLTSGAPLPPAQVVRPTPRGIQPYTAANVPTLLPVPSLTPAPRDQITFEGGVLAIPE